MSGNLINNYIYSRTPDKGLNKNAKIENLKPLSPKGKLLKNSITDTPEFMVNQLAYDFKSLKNGLKGDSNDHQLGKVNDIGMKLGGLGIAAYLFSKRFTPMTKAMEFVGFASFFASMAIWPKIAIELPSRIVHGFNPHKRYQDSQGRVKPFFQDPQYLPWDLYGDEEINKIGDRLGVKVNMPNRREFIQEKMKKIAIQNNTLWMLTAGFATPVLSALICNALEKPVLNIQNKITNHNIEKIRVNLNKYANILLNKNKDKSFDYLIENYKNSPLTTDVLSRLADAMASGLNPDIKTDVNKYLVQDLAIKFNLNNKIIDNYAIKASYTAIHDVLSEKLPKEVLTIVMPDEAEYKKLFVDKNYYNQVYDMQSDVFRKMKLNIRDLFKEHVQNKNVSDNLKNLVPYEVVEILSDTFEPEYGREKISPLKTSNARKLDYEAISYLSKVKGALHDFYAKSIVLDKYAYKKVAKAPETIIAHEWNKISNTIFKVLEFTPEEIKNVRYDRLLVQDLLREKLENIVSDDAKYASALAKITDAIKNIDLKITQSSVDDYNSKVKTVYSAAAKKLNELGLYQSANKIFNADNDFATLTKFKQSVLNDRLLGVKSSFYRLINTFDLYRRVAKGDFSSVLPNNIALETREEIIEFSKQLILQGHPSDHAIKGNFKRNPEPAECIDDILVEGGKVINKFYGETEGVDMPWDWDFYNKIMKFSYGNRTEFEYAHKFDSLTERALNKHNLFKNLSEYNKRFYEVIGGAEYFQKLMHKTTWGKNETPEVKFLLVGLAPDEHLTKIIKQKYNSGVWLKKFATFGIVLFGITALIQLSFGKMRNENKERIK